MKRPLFWTGAIFLSSLAVFLRLTPLYAALSALALIAFAVFLSSNKLKLRRVMLFFCAAILGAAAAFGYSTAKNAYLAPIIASEYADIVMVSDDFDNTVGYRRITGKALITVGDFTRTADITVWGYFDDPPAPGEMLSVRGKAASPLVYSAKELLSPPEEAPFKFTAFRLKAQSRISQRIFDLSFDDSCSGVLSALLTGDRSHIPDSVTGAFRKSSLSHLLAISGMHIVLISAAVQGLFCPIMGEKRSILLSTLICWCFACIAGLGVSVIRACVMITVMNLGGCFRRKSDTLTSLMLSAIIIALFSPEALFSASFLLSFSAVMGLAVFAPKAKPESGIFSSIKQSIGVSAAAQLGTLPVCALLFRTVPLIGIFANIAAVWLLWPIMLLGIAGVLLGFILPFAAEILLLPSLIIIKLLLFIANAFAAVPFSSESIREYWQLIWLIAASLLIIITFCRAPKGFCRRLALALIAAVYLSAAVFSVCLDKDRAYLLLFEDFDCCAVIKSGHALIFGSAENTYQLYDIENAFTRLGVQRLDGVIVTRHEQLNYMTVSLADQFGCEAVFAEGDRYYSQLCRSAGLKLYHLPADGKFFGKVTYIPAESGFELTFESGKILKSGGKYVIIGRYHPMLPIDGVLCAEIDI